MQPGQEESKGVWGAPEVEDSTASRPLTCAHPLFALLGCVSRRQRSGVPVSLSRKAGFPGKSSLRMFPQMTVSCFF